MCIEVALLAEAAFDPPGLSTVMEGSENRKDAMIRVTEDADKPRPGRAAARGHPRSPFANHPGRRGAEIPRAAAAEVRSPVNRRGPVRRCRGLGPTGDIGHPLDGERHLSCKARVQ